MPVIAETPPVLNVLPVNVDLATAASKMQFWAFDDTRLSFWNRGFGTAHVGSQRDEDADRTCAFHCVAVVVSSVTPQ